MRHAGKNRHEPLALLKIFTSHVLSQGNENWAEYQVKQLKQPVSSDDAENFNLYFKNNRESLSALPYTSSRTPLAYAVAHAFTEEVTP